LIASDGAEVAGAQEGRHLVVVARALDRIVDAKAGVAEILRHATFEIVPTVIELVG
jgi:hypothetical protein